MPDAIQRYARRRRRDTGSTVLEWVLICGLISIVAFAMIAGVGAKAMARWSSVNEMIP